MEKLERYRNYIQELLSEYARLSPNDDNQMEIKINIGSEVNPPSLVSAHDKMKKKDLVTALKLVANNQ
ncbi:XisI protein [Limnofasciculus baicalensis]|uniref:XisI protein n=1 Tax=Limnofasciculus baicalensis BBK-W-15 TaxID=2699891 RepID=A0AAE3GU19_9CYAN|nr:XisI protein [Limnofasciculus baicalensis]MCP2729753.1 XisI protein [Limnofasciculus baicalensis BBK-W-15]